MYFKKNIFYYKITMESKPYIYTVTKLCSEFEVDITKIEVPKRFCLAIIPKIATG